MLVLIKHTIIEHFLDAGSSREIRTASWSPGLSLKDNCGSRLERKAVRWQTGKSVLPDLILGTGSGFFKGIGARGGEALWVSTLSVQGSFWSGIVGEISAQCKIFLLSPNVDLEVGI